MRHTRLHLFAALLVLTLGLGGPSVAMADSTNMLFHPRPRVVGRDRNRPNVLDVQRLGLASPLPGQRRSLGARGAHDVPGLEHRRGRGGNQVGAGRRTGDDDPTAESARRRYALRITARDGVDNCAPRCPIYREVERCAAGSGQSSSRQHIAEGRPLLLSSAAVEPRSMQAVRRNRSKTCFGLPIVCRYPGDDRRKVGTLRENRSAFDNRTARGVRTGQPLHQGENCIFVHSSHRTLPAKSRLGELELACCA